MVSRFSRSLIVALLVSLLAMPALAGGWAVITLDGLPSKVVAGEPITIGFTVRQHGRTLMTGLAPTITANLPGDDEFVMVNAVPEGEPGHYTAILNFPKEGAWQWTVQAFTMEQSMPVLNVAPATGAAVDTTSPQVTSADSAFSGLSPMMWGSIVALLVGLIGALVAFRSRSRPVMGLTAISLLAGVTLLITGAGQASAVEAQTNSVSEAAEVSSTSQVEYGRQLFVVKGCITCHHNSKVGDPSKYWTLDVGAPDLSKFSANPEVIFMRLKDPSSVKSDTQMPQLNLNESEIEALVAFINSK